MIQCPYCGSDLPNDQDKFCIECNHIIDDDFLLRKEIKKELESMSPAKMKAKDKKNYSQPAGSNKRNGDDYVPINYHEKRSYANIILVVIVAAIILYMLFK